MSSLLSAEIAAACNSLGYFDGKKYQKDRYCLETVKELIRHLRRDRANHEARCLLGEAKVLQKDLIPLLTDYHEDKELFNILLRLLVNLIHPVLLLFGEEEPSDPQQRQLYLTILAHQQEYKKAFIIDSALSVLAVRLSKLLEIEWNERDEDTSLTIERILILVRNILQVPADLTEEQRADNDASIHDQVLWACHTSGINPIFLYLASTETEQNFYMHILEILSQMLREQNATQLATAAAARSVEERRKDENELTKLRQAENEARQAKLRQFRGARHSKFGGTYYLKNVKSVSERDLISHKPLHSIAAIDFDLNKTKVKTPKNRRPEGTEIIERRSAYSVRLFLKELCVEFLNGAYNALMFHVKESLVRNRGQENDETYYLWAMRFFMEFNRSYKFRIELVSETMSVQTFHWVQNQLDRCHEMLIMLKKNRRNWVKRQHHALKAYQELLMTLQAMDKCGDDSVKNSARVIKSNIFYVVEYREMSQMLLQSYDPTKLPTNYLRDLIETNHVFLKMLEHFCKTSHLMVQKRKRKSKPKKKKKTKEPGAQEKKSAEELWEEGVAEELSAVIQSDPETPENLPLPFYASSDLSEIEQKTVCIRRIQNYMKQREFAEAIAMFKAACEFWPELCTNEEDGEGEQTDDQFVALKEIFLAELPPDPNEEASMAPEHAAESAESDQDGDEESENFVEITEQNFNFEEFILKFAHPRVVAACGLVIRDFNKPGVTPAQVHAGVKLLHRICVDCKRPAMAFQASMFRTFQRALRAQRQGGMDAVNSKELAQFACYIMQVFAKVSRTNPHVYIELLFFKTSREAVEVVEGYGSYESSATGKNKVKRGVWTEEQEDELERLFAEFKGKMQEEGGKIKEKELVDQIWENLIDNSSRSRAAVLSKLKEMELLEARGSSRWSEADLDQLRELYGRFSESDDVLTEIEQRLSSKRSQAVICKRLIELGLATKESLRLKRPPKAPKSKKAGKGRNRRNSSSSESEDDVRPRPQSTEMPMAKTHNYSKQGTIKAVQAAIANGNTGAVRWLMSALSEAAEDRTNDEDEPTPLVPLSEDDSTALEDPSFLQLLQNLGLSEPIEGQELYWRIPGELNLSQLMAQCELLAGALDGRLDALEAAPDTQTQVDSPARPNRRTRLESDSDSDREDTRAGSSKDVTGKRKHAASTDSDSGPQIDQPSSLKLKKSKPKKKKLEKSAKNINSSDTDDSIDYDLLGVNKDTFKRKSSAKKKIVRPVDSSDDEAMVIDETVTSTQVAGNNLVSSDEETPKSHDRSVRKRALDSSDEEPVQSVSNPGPVEISSDEERPPKTQNSKRTLDSSDEDEPILSNGTRNAGPVEVSSDEDKPAKAQKSNRALDSSDDDEPLPSVSNGTRNAGPVEVSSDEDKPAKAQKSKRALDSSDDDEPLPSVSNGKKNVDPVEVSSDEDRPLKTQNSKKVLDSSDEDEPKHSATDLGPTEISSDEEKLPKAHNSSRRLDSSDEDEPILTNGKNKETPTEISSDEDMPLKSNKDSKSMPNKSVIRVDAGEISSDNDEPLLTE